MIEWVGSQSPSTIIGQFLFITSIPDTCPRIWEVQMIEHEATQSSYQGHRQPGNRRVSSSGWGCHTPQPVTNLSCRSWNYMGHDWYYWYNYYNWYYYWYWVIFSWFFWLLKLLKIARWKSVVQYRQKEVRALYPIYLSGLFAMNTMARSMEVQGSSSVKLALYYVLQ